MKPEQAIAAFVYNTTFKDLPAEQVAVAKKQILTIFGAAVAGSASEGCETVAEMAKEQGGKPESTLLVFGGKVPAKEAAFVNATMGRALDICDHIQPGLHAGSAVIPTALAVAEMMGGCTGEELITAVAIGTEIPLRINRTMQVIEYDGFDPTGVVGVFGAAAAAAKLMKLDEKQILNALGLAFNRSGATYQNNIDGCLGVRIMEGWVAQAGIECAKLAARGITGPKNFLDGVYGFCHLFGRDREGVTGARIVEDLGKVWHLTTLNFKKYPSCGLTQGSTELILEMMGKYGLTPENVDHIDVDVPEGTYNLVGKPFVLGENPKVDAQFGLPYCIANALYRKTIQLSQFEEAEIRDPAILDFARNKVTVIPSLSLETRKHYSADITVYTKDGKKYFGQSEIPPGTPKKPLTDEDFRQRFFDCMVFGAKPVLQERAESNYALLGRVETLADIRELIQAFTM